MGGFPFLRQVLHQFVNTDTGNYCDDNDHNCNDQSQQCHAPVGPGKALQILIAGRKGHDDQQNKAGKGQHEQQTPTNIGPGRHRLIFSGDLLLDGRKGSRNRLGNDRNHRRHRRYRDMDTRSFLGQSRTAFSAENSTVCIIATAARTVHWDASFEFMGSITPIGSILHENCIVCQ